ncbi:hypothetical protein VP1G_01134 [Cytospora mali]|uniref:Uncharacterized protein n=1 Tax=Cytospora mali TaxID=578113 RepID=A0A194UQ87_CYTMA|nr:hypothetical protein VP1G_01134 [Valsa mali var. pyri (nom. inval.)]
MNTLQQIETQAEKLAMTAKALAKQFREAGLNESSTPWGSADFEPPREVDRLRNNMLATIARLQTMLVGPTDFIQQLAHQTQVLACLQWLGEFQVLACIPLNGSMSTKDLADLVNVPGSQLRRVVRLMATAGFLQEPQPGSGQVAHTGLSASFVTNFPNLDAVMLLSGTAAPAALQMSEATQRQLSGFTLSSNTGLPFTSACEQQPRLKRQWSAYLGCVGDTSQVLVDLLDRLDWASLGNVCIVDVDAESIRVAEGLAERHPALRWVVQMSESAAADITSVGGLNPRITVQIRTPQATQTLEEAAVYVLRGTEPDYQSLANWVQIELQSHLNVLRANPNALLLLALQLRPDPGSVDPSVEAVACARDMTVVQLTGDTREMNLKELEELIACVRDSGGRLVVVNKLRSNHCSTIALGIKYRPKAQPLGLITPNPAWSVTLP